MSLLNILRYSGFDSAYMILAKIEFSDTKLRKLAQYLAKHQLKQLDTPGQSQKTLN